MIWPYVLPFKLAFWLLAGLVVTATVVAPSFKRKRSSTLGNSFLLALVAFIPSCIGIKFVVDNFRFGEFVYQNYTEVNDFRIERFLPPAATHITLHKHANGHRARYKIAEAEFHSYLDSLWEKHGAYSAVKRDEWSDESRIATLEGFEQELQTLGWEPLVNAVIYHSPVEADGGGATYYYDDEAGIAYHRAGYW
jgi:hypothetical protein